MRNFHVKSILLGIGIGIVITSLISMIYTAGINTNRSISNEVIIEKAKELGMVDGTSIVDTLEKDSEQKGRVSEEKIESPSSDNTVKKAEENSNNKDIEKQVEKADEPKKASEISISIKPGDTSEVVATKLVGRGLIKDKVSFISKLGDMGLSTEINVGDFKIREGSGMVEIIRILTNTK